MTTKINGMKPATIALSAAHHPKSPGVGRGNVTEYGLSSAIIGDLTFRLDKAGHNPWIIGADSNTDQVTRINELNADFGFELHFNSVEDPEPAGCMTLHYDSTRGKQLAECIQSPLVTALGNRDRGTRLGYHRLNPSQGWNYMIERTNCPFVIVEPLFFSNLTDFEKIDIPLISIALFNGCMDYWAKNGRHI